MVKKLKYLLTNQTRWNYLYRPILLAVVLGFVFRAWVNGSSILLGIIPVVLGGIFYLTENPSRKLIRTSFWSYIFFSSLSLWLLATSLLPIAVKSTIGVISLIAVVVIYRLLSGLIEFHFEDRFLIYNILNTIILALTFLSFFTIFDPNPGLYLLLLFLVVSLIFKEVFNFYGLKGKRPTVISFTLGLISAQLTWFTSILPLGVINSSVFLVLVFTLLRDIVLAHFQGSINRQLILRQFTFLILLSILIFASTSWSI